MLVVQSKYMASARSRIGDKPVNVKVRMSRYCYLTIDVFKIGCTSRV